MSLVFSDKSLSSNEKLVLLAITDCANDDGVCWPSLLKLSSKCSMSKDGLCRIITRLSDNGYLTKKRRFSSSTIYTVSIPDHNRSKVDSDIDPKSILISTEDRYINIKKKHKEESSFLKHENEAVKCWNDLAEKLNLSKVAKLTETRKKKLVARLKDCGGIEGWKAAIEKVSTLRWMHGENKSGWKVNFDFLLQESSFVKLMEGSYDERNNSTEQKFTNGYAQQLTEMFEKGDFEF